MTRHAKGHNRDGVHCRIQFFQVVQGPFELFAVVQSLAHDQLAVHCDAAFRKAVHDFQCFARMPVLQHFNTQLRVGRLHRDIDRRDVHAQDAVHVRLGQIGHGNIVAHQEGHPRVVVLDIQGFAHPFWQLIDKAEHTLVGTLLHLIHQVVLKIQAERLPFALAHAHLTDSLPVLLEDFERQACVIAVKLVVQHIPDCGAVDLQQGLPRRKPRTGRRAALVHADDFRRHFTPSF